MKHLVVQLNNVLSSDYIDFDEPENIVSSKYFDIEKLQNQKIPSKGKLLSLFHINTCSLSKNFDDFQHLLSCTKKNCDIIAINETMITKNVSITNIIKYYSFEFNPTEFSTGNTLLYIANQPSYKPHEGLNIYKKNEPKSSFIELMNPQKMKYYYWYLI